jgi:hypothetical protein
MGQLNAKTAKGKTGKTKGQAKTSKRIDRASGSATT